MMKRFLTLVLCLCMMCTATVALAENEVTYPNGAANFDEEVGVNITAIATDTAVTNAADVYSVEIVWGDMKFAWGVSSVTIPATWNPETHQYEDEDGNAIDEIEEAWYMLSEGTSLSNAGAVELSLTTQDAVLVFNHSNKPVNAKIETKDETEGDTDALTATFTKSGNAVAATEENTWTLKEGTVGDVYANDGSSVMGTVKINENMSTVADYANAVTIAKLNVTISKPVASN